MNTDKTLKIWIDGKFYDRGDAKLSVYDHGLLYGDGVFEGIRVYHGRIFECAAHLKRLFDSARSIRLSVPYTADQLRAAMEATFKLNGFTDCYIRVLVTRGQGPLGIDPASCKDPVTVIITDSIQVYPRELYEMGLPIITACTVKNHANALPPRIKSMNYLNNILARQEANDAGVREAVMLNQAGNVTECTAVNIFIVQDSVVITPTVADGILEGITRSVVMKLAAQLGIACHERSFGRQNLYTADECFLTGTGAEIIPVISVDQRPVGNGHPGPITRRLIEAFSAHVKK